MRRFAFLAISLVLLFAVVIPAHATPRSQEVVEYRGPRERDAGASGDDDLPSKEGSQIEPVAVPPTQYEEAGNRVHQVFLFLKRVVTRFSEHVNCGSRLSAGRRR